MKYYIICVVFFISCHFKNKKQNFIKETTNNYTYVDLPTDSNAIIATLICDTNRLNKELKIFKENCDFVTENKINDKFSRILHYNEEGNVSISILYNHLSDNYEGPFLFYHNNGIIKQYSFMKESKIVYSLQFDSTGKATNHEGFPFLVSTDRRTEKTTYNFDFLDIPYHYFGDIQVKEMVNGVNGLNNQVFKETQFSYTSSDSSNQLLLRYYAFSILNNDTIIYETTLK